MNVSHNLALRPDDRVGVQSSSTVEPELHQYARSVDSVDHGVDRHLVAAGAVELENDRIAEGVVLVCGQLAGQDRTGQVETVR